MQDWAKLRVGREFNNKLNQIKIKNPVKCPRTLTFTTPTNKISSKDCARVTFMGQFIDQFSMSTYLVENIQYADSSTEISQE